MAHSAKIPEPSVGRPLSNFMFKCAYLTWSFSLLNFDAFEM